MNRLAPLPSRAGSEVASCSVNMISDSIYGTGSSEEGRALRGGGKGKICWEIKMFDAEKSG